MVKLSRFSLRRKRGVAVGKDGSVSIDGYSATDTALILGSKSLRELTVLIKSGADVQVSCRNVNAREAVKFLDLATRTAQRRPA